MSSDMQHVGLDIGSFFKQKNIDVFITTTPNEVSKKILSKIKFKTQTLKLNLLREINLLNSQVMKKTLMLFTLL